ncbi:MAG TPA: hypothetical protein VF627_01285, partial [Abditibacterium sp.]
MPETTSDPQPVKVRAPRGLINKNYTDSLQKSQNVLDAALNPLYNAEIVDGVEITAAFLTGLGTQIGDARTFLASTTAGRGTAKGSTALQNSAKIALCQALQGIQTRAYQKFHAAQPDRVRSTYFGGTDLFGASDALLPQIVTSFLENAPGDALPKVDAARLAALQNLSDAWEAARGEQGTTGGAAITDFEQFKTVLA